MCTFTNLPAECRFGAGCIEAGEDSVITYWMGQKVNGTETEVCYGSQSIIMVYGSWRTVSRVISFCQ